LKFYSAVGEFYNIFEAINVVSDRLSTRETFKNHWIFENLYNIALKRTNSEGTFRNILGMNVECRI